MFDSSKPITINLLSGREKTCVLAFPTDEQWCARTRKQHTIQHFIGRGKSKSQAINAEKADAELFDQIRQDKDGDAFDTAEKVAAITRLEKCRILTTERIGDSFKIEASVRGAKTVHTLRIPTEQESRDYSDAAADFVNGRRNREIRMSIEPSGALYDKLVKKVEGYEGDVVPIVHKDAVVVEVLMQVQEAIEDDDDPNG
jgi:hypothetical protein